MKPNPLLPLLGLAEKAAWTYFQALIALTLVTGTALSFSTQTAVAALPAALTVLANGLPVTIDGLTYAQDIAFRIVRSFAAGFLGYLLAIPVFTLDASVLQGAKTAGVIAALVVLKGYIAKMIGDPATAATLPA